MSYLTQLLSIVFCFILGAMILAKPGHAATLAFTASEMTIPVGQSRRISMTLNPQGKHILGVDLLLRYNPDHLRLDAVHGLSAFSQAPVMTHPTQGKTRIAIFNPYGAYVTQTSAILDLEITSLASTEQTELEIVYSPHDTMDSNVVILGGEDVLNPPTNLTIHTTVSPKTDKPLVLGTKSALSHRWSWWLIIGVGLTLLGAVKWALSSARAKQP